MGNVACFEIPGLRCWFWSNDHEPPHFHVERIGEWEMKVLFLREDGRMFELLWGETPRNKVLRMIENLVEAHRDQLTEEWEAKVNR